MAPKAGMIVATGLALAAGLAVAFSDSIVGGFSNKPAETPPAPAPLAQTQTDPSSSPRIAPRIAPKITPKSTQTPAPAVPPRPTIHFNNAANSDYVLVCLRGTSIARENALSAQDKAKAAQYEKDMLKISKNLISNPTPALAGLFKQNAAIVLNIIAWDASITKADIGDIDVIPHQSSANQACPRDSSPLGKFRVP